MRLGSDVIIAIVDITTPYPQVASAMVAPLFDIHPQDVNRWHILTGHALILLGLGVGSGSGWGWGWGHCKG